MDTLNTQTSFLVAAPRKPNDRALLKKISAAMADIDQVREAHLPEVIEIGVTTQARLMLFVLIEPESDSSRVHKLLKRRLGGLFSTTSNIAIQAISNSYPLLQAIRDTNTVVGWRD